MSTNENLNNNRNIHQIFPNKVLWKIVKLFADIHLVFVEHFIQSYFASYALIYIIKVTKPGLLTFSDKLIDKQLQEGEIISHWSYVNIKYGGPRVEQPVWPTGGW